LLHLARFVLLDEEPVAEDRSVVDEAVQAAHLLRRPHDGRGDLALVGDIDATAVDRRRQLGEPLLVHVERGGLSAGLDDAVGEMRAHALGATGDDALHICKFHEAERYYPARSATIGSIPAARRAGAQQASMATPTTSATTPT